MTELKRIIEHLNGLWPTDTSEPWDNDGVDICISGEQNISTILVALDATSAVIQRAEEISARLIITHHPLIFEPLPSILGFDPYGKRIMECIKKDISVISYHTRLDLAEGGVADTLAELVGLQNLTKLYPGITLGDCSPEKTYAEFTRQIKEKTNTDMIYGVNSTDRVKKVAVVGGSGKSFLTEVIRSGADTFLTGEVTHSAMIETKELGLNLVCATHHATENVVLPKIKQALITAFPDLTVEIMGFDPKVEYGV